MGLFAALNFGAPWILAALVGLPGLWWLLKVTPPQPRRILFPPLRLLFGLKDEEQTPAHTPWWLMLLRVLAAGLLILALADPLLGRVTKIVGGGPMVVVVDNGWTAARNWDQRQTLIADLLRAAGNRSVAIVPTATLGTVTLLDAGAAEKTARELKPMSWPGDRQAAAAEIQHAHLSGRPEFFWLSDGIEDGQGKALSATLENMGSLRIFAPDQTGHGLLPPRRDATGFAVTAIRANSGAPASIKVAAIGSKGETLSDAALTFNAGQDRGDAHITVPLEVRNQTARLQIQNEDSAGAVQLMDSGGIEHRVGLVSAAPTENEQPLLSDVYYLERALSPFAQVEKGTVSGLIARHVSILFLADIGRISGSDAEAVEKFLKGGGVLIRFAGPRMAGGTDTLVPTSLRVGGRYLGSAMAWNQPQHLASFPLTSPFNGLGAPNEVTVSRQILAEPSAELAGRTWARLADGTPLVTARQEGAGWLVLFHITASPAWSTLPLSGLYVDMLKRLLALSAGTPAASLARLSSLAPISILDGFGHMEPPSPDILPIAASDFEHAQVSAKHPPGLYGARGV
ncbi:MAG TPA: BatA domain-containing protein, partial [Rhizomicrobium sp.]